MNGNLPIVAAEIARRLPEMARDSAINNADCIERILRALGADAFKVGSMSVRALGADKFWLMNGAGEALETNRAKLEAALQEFFTREF